MTIVSIFFPKFDAVYVSLILQYPEAFDLVGRTGSVLRADHSSNFTASTEILFSFQNYLQSLPANTDQLFGRLLTTSGRQTLHELLQNSHSTCLHSVGSDLLGIYLNTWFSIDDVERPPLIPF